MAATPFLPDEKETQDAPSHAPNGTGAGVVCPSCDPVIPVDVAVKIDTRKG